MKTVMHFYFKLVPTLVLIAAVSNFAYSQAWDAQGNNVGATDFLGTTNTQDLRLKTTQSEHINLFTEDEHRIKLNPDVNYTINGYAGDRDGFMLLGTAGSSTGPLFTNDTIGAFSQLHLTDMGNINPNNGYRPWMRTGVTYTSNADLSYMGMRTVANSVTETVVAWANDGLNQWGPDDLCFRFIGGGEGVTTISSNLATPTDFDGLHVARFSSTGNIGFGPTFGVDDPLYVRPRSLLHLSLNDSRDTWLQITNEDETDQTDVDGLRIGIVDTSAIIRHQENYPIIFQTDWNNTAGGTADGERMRITSIGATNVPQPAGAADDNYTRVAISHDGDEPITEPRSLLHLGYNTGGLVASADGWRDWMDVGMFVNRGTDNMYVGLKEEEDPDFGDRYDAVVNWGDNQGPFGGATVGPDNLRFIFTSTETVSPGDPVSRSNNGLEIARMEPGLASTLDTNFYDFGMMGIGNFAPGSPNDVNGTPVDAKLDIDGDLRIREVTKDSTLNMVLVIDTSDLGRVHYRSLDDISGAGIGNYCSEPDDTLAGHYEIPLNDYNYYFTGSQPYPDITNNTNGVAIGLDCADPLLGKLHVLQDEGNFLGGTGLFSVTGYFDNTDDDAFTGVGVYGIAQGEKLIGNIAGVFEAYDGVKSNVGVNGYASTNAVGATTTNIGGNFLAEGGDRNYGIFAKAGLDSVGDVNNAAGYFDGDVMAVGGYYVVSDEILKENIEQIQSASETLGQLRPVDYDMRYEQYSNMSLQQTRQLGLIAQEVEQVLPDIVGDIVHPAKYDSLGNEISPAMELKGVNYIQLIPLLIAGFQEHEVQLAQQDSLNEKLSNDVQSLMEKLEAMEACLREVNLCGTQKNATQESEPTFGQAVELKNRSAIILEQNLPNPFAEQTTIAYTIPEEVMKAELVFYDMQGRIINQVQLTERGQGKLTVYGENLRNGVYTYSLIADGKLIATKKMVKQ